MNNPPAPSLQIGISVYQQPLTWVQQSVRSALAQQAPGDLQVSVRSDGPDACDSDTLLWLRQAYENNPRLRFTEGQTRLGTYGSLKAIFQDSDSTYLCQLDADDWLQHDAVALSLETMAVNPHAPFLYTDCQEVTKAGDPIGVGARSRTPFSQERMLVQFITYHLRVIRRSAYNKAGGYDTRLLYTGDYDLSLKLCEQGTPIHLPAALYNYRLHGSNTSGRHRQSTIQEAFEVAQRALTRRRQDHIHELILEASKSQVTLRPRQGPLAIAGMHRSGTSLLALALQRLGIDLGTNLIGADQQNPDGYGEDQEVVTLQRAALRRSTPGSEGWPDWGWSAQSDASRRVHADEQWQKEARQYLNQRSDSRNPWGWKDPRTTLFLEDWLQLDPGMKLIAVYRDPWDVIDALQRINPPIFALKPQWALQIWIQYNQALIRFIKKNPERSILIHSSILRKHPERLIEALKSKWQWMFKAPTADLSDSLKKLVRPDRLLSNPANEQLAKLHQTCSPMARSVLQALDDAAMLAPTRGELNDQRDPANTLKLMQVITEPELSIVITSFNQGDLLLEAIASAEKAATTHRVELVIVDDGSTDPRTIDILKHLDSIGYKLIRQHNQGLAASRNTGIAATTAPFLLFLDDDNRLLPAYTEEGLKLLHRHARIDAVYGNCQEFGLSSRLRRVGIVNADELWTMNRVDNCTLLRRTLLKRCGGYDTDLTAFEDWDLWLTAMASPEGLCLGYLDQTCFEYRVRPNSMLQRLFHNQPLQNKIMAHLRQKHGSRVGHGGFEPTTIQT